MNRRNLLSALLALPGLSLLKKREEPPLPTPEDWERFLEAIEMDRP